MSTVVRLPDGLYESARHFAALQGRQASDLLTEAWEQYVRDHRDQLASDLEQTARLLRAGDPHELARLVPSRRARGAGGTGGSSG
ncbi:MAG TPA: hypothetical protein VFF79_02565 [Conexibacter sp.]|jgi:hypothetical protein|nr:hypothetical protein [Conexibacter sp.]